MITDIETTDTIERIINYADKNPDVTLKEFCNSIKKNIQQSEKATPKKHHHYAVCIDEGKFDTILYETRIKAAAKAYFDLSYPLCPERIVMKEMADVRALKEAFTTEDFPTEIWVSKSN